MDQLKCFSNDDLLTGQHQISISTSFQHARFTVWATVHGSHTCTCGCAFFLPRLLQIISFRIVSIRVSTVFRMFLFSTDGVWLYGPCTFLGGGLSCDIHACRHAHARIHTHTHTRTHMSRNRQTLIHMRREKPTKKKRKIRTSCNANNDVHVFQSPLVTSIHKLVNGQLAVALCTHLEHRRSSTFQLFGAPN